MASLETPPSSEGYRLRGRRVEPLCVVDHAQDRSFCAQSRQETDQRQTHEHSVGCSPGAPTEDNVDRVTLGCRQLLYFCQPWLTEL